MNTVNYNKDFCLCSKYIIPIITNELEAREFWRFFLTKCAEADVSPAMLTQVASAAYNGNLGLNVDTDYLLKYDGEVQDLPELIDLIQYERSKKEGEFVDCRAYCASKLYASDSASKAGLCKICERFNKWDYSNRLIEEDYSIIKYISLNNDNLQTFSKQISALSNKNDVRNPFKSLVELTRDYICYTDTPPVVIPIFNAMYTAICVASSKNTFYNVGAGVGERLRDEQFFMNLTASLCKRDPYFKQFSESHIDYWRTQYDIFVDKVLDAPDIFNADQFTDIIEDHLKNYWTSRRTRVKTQGKVVKSEDEPQITLFDIIENSNAEEPDDAHIEYRPADIEPVDEPLDFDEMSEEESVDENNVVSAESAEPSEVVSTLEESDATDVTVTEDISETSEPVEKSGTKELRVDESGETVTEDGALVFGNESSDSGRTRINVNRRPDKAGGTGKANDDIYVPHYPVYKREDIEKVFVSMFSQPNIYYSTRLSKEKNGSYVIDALSLEVLYVEDEGWILVFTSQKDDKVWYCPIKDIPTGLVKILQSDKVVKICYEPYIIYSSLRNVGVRARGCYSLFNMNRYLNIKKEVTDIASMEELYFGLSRGNAPLDSLSMTKLTSEQIMEYYRLYAFQQTIAPTDRREKVRVQLLRDEILGYSYMRETFLYDESVLFIRGEKGLLFNNNYVHSPTVSGYFVTYYLRTDSMDNSQRQRMYLYLLTDMMEKGVVRKYDFYIVALSEGILTLFIAEESYSYITNMMHERMDMFALDNELRGYVFEMVEEYIDVTLDLTDDERYARAVRHNDRMNELRRIRKAEDFIDKNSLELDKSIEISEKHIHINPAPDAIESKKQP